MTSAQEQAVDETELDAIKSEDLRQYRAFAAQGASQLAEVPTAAMRTVWGRANAKVAELPLAIRERAHGQAMTKMMEEHVTAKKRVLCIDGGGIRGLLPALVIAELERTCTKKVRSGQADSVVGSDPG